MRLIIVGATGRTGRILVYRALAQGHEVTAFARHPESLTTDDALLRTVKGDALDPSSLEAAIPGHDAVLLAIGSNDRGPTTVRSDAVRNTLAAMNKAGVRRLVAMSGLGAGVTRKNRGVLYDWVLAPLRFRHTLNDQNALEATLRRSELDWIVVRPGQMTDEPARRKWVVSFDGFGITDSVSREDVALFMLDQLKQDEYVRKAIAIGYDIPAT